MLSFEEFKKRQREIERQPNSEERAQESAPWHGFSERNEALGYKAWQDWKGNVNLSNLNTGETNRFYQAYNHIGGADSNRSPAKDNLLADIGQSVGGALQRQGASYKGAGANLLLSMADLFNGKEEFQPKVGSALWRMQQGAKADMGVANQLFEDSKTGHGKAYGLVMDLTSGAVDLASDALLTAATGGASIGGKLGITAGLGAMGARSFGSGAMEAEEKGLSRGQQFLSGLKSATIEMLTEKIGGPFEKAYGASALGKTTKSLAERLSKNAGMEFALKALGNFASEGGEEVLSDVLNPLADKLLRLDNGEGWQNLWTSDGFSQMAYDGLVGGLLGFFGGAVEGLSPSERIRAASEGMDNALAASQQGRSIAAELENDKDGRIAQAISNQAPTAPQTLAEAQQQSPPTETAPSPQTAVKQETGEFNDEPDVEQPKQKHIGKKSARDIAFDAWFNDNVRQDIEPEGVAVDASDFANEVSTTEPESGKVEARKAAPTAAERLANYNNPQTTDAANRGLKDRVESAVRNALAQNGIDYSNDPRAEYYDENAGEYREEDLDLLDEESRAKYLSDMRQIRLLDAVDEWLDKNGQKYLSAKKGSEAEVQQDLQNALNDYVRRYLDSQTDKASNSEAVEDVMQQRRQDDRLKSLAKEKKQEAPTGYNTVQVGDNLFRVTGPGGITTTEVADNSADAVQKHIDGLTEENRKKAKERKEKEKALKQLRKEVQESQENPTRVDGSDGKAYEVTKELTRGENNYQYVVTELDEDGLPTDMEARIFRTNAKSEEEAVQRAIEHPEYFNDGLVEGEDWGERNANERENIQTQERKDNNGKLAREQRRVGERSPQSKRKSSFDPVARKYFEEGTFGAFPEVDEQTKADIREEWGDDAKIVSPRGWQSELSELITKVTGARVYWVAHSISEENPMITHGFTNGVGDIIMSATMADDALENFFDENGVLTYSNAAHEVIHHLVDELFNGGYSGLAREIVADSFGKSGVDKAICDDIIRGEAYFYYPDKASIDNLSIEEQRELLDLAMQEDPDFADLVYSETLCRMAGSCDLHMFEGSEADNYDALKTLFDTARGELVGRDLIAQEDLNKFPDYDVVHYFFGDNPYVDYINENDTPQNDVLRNRTPKRKFKPYTPRKGYGYIDVSDESKLSDIDKAVVQDSKSYLEKQEKAIRRYSDGEGVVSGAGFRNMHGDEFEDSILQRKLEEEGAWIENERDGHDWFDIDNAKDWIAEEKLKRLDTVANFRGNINDRNTGYYMMLDVTRSLAKQKLLEAEIAKEEARRKEFGTSKAEEVKAEEPKKVEEAPNPVEPPKLKEPPKAKSGAEILSEAAQKSAKPKPTPKSSTVSQKEQPKTQKPKQEAPKAKPKNESLGLDQQKNGYPEPEEPATPKRSAPPSDLNETLNEMSRERDAKAKAKDAGFEAKRAEDKQQTNAKEYAYNKKLEAEEAGTESSDEEKAKSTFGDGYDKVQKSAEDFGKIKTRFDEDAFKESGKKQDKATRNKLGKLRELFTNAATTGDVESLFSFYESLKDDPNLSNFYNEDVQEDIDNFRKLVDENLDTYNEGAAPYAAARTMQKMAHKFAKANEYQQTLKKMNETLRGSKNGLVRKIGKSDKLTASVARALMRWQVNPDTVFKMIDAFDKGNMGEGYKLAKELQTAHREKYRVLQQARARFDKASSLDGYDDFIYGKQKVKDYSGREWDMRSALSVVKAIDTIRSTSGKKLGGTDGFGVMDSKGNIEYIDMSDVDAVKLYESLKSGLSDVAIKFGDIANDAFNDVKEPLRKKFKDINGVDIQMIGDIDQRLGDKKGIEKAVYSPLSYVDKNGNTYQFDIAKQDTYNNIPRFLRERSDNGGTYLLIKPYTEVTNKYFEQVSNYLAYSEFNEKMRGLGKGSSYESGLGNTLADVFGKDMGNWYRSYVEDLATYQNEDDVEGVNSLLRQGRQRLQQGALLFSVSVPMKQISSYWAASGILHPDSLIQAYRIKLLKPKNGSDAATMLASRAMGNLEQSAAEAAKDAEKWLGKLKYSSKFIKMAANAINQMDYNTVSNLLSATEYDVLKYQFNNDTSKIGTEEFNQAVEELFQDVVDRSQPNFDKQMRAEYGRTDNEIIRMLSMFRTQQTQNLNLLATAIGEYQASKGTANQAKATETLKQTIAGQAASAFSLSMLTILADMLLHRQKKYEDEEQDIDISKVLTRLGINAIEASSGTLWFGDAVAKWAIDRISGGSTKEFYGVNMGVISTVSDILENFETAIKSPTRSNIKKCAGNIATIMGIPLNNAYSMLNSAIMYAKDLTGDNEGDYDDILRYLDAQTKAAKKAEEKAAKEAAKQAEKSGASLLADIANNKYGKGNIDLTDRNTGLYDEDGNIMTVKSMSFEEDGKEILVPTIVKKNGKWVELSDKDAIDWYHKTGEYLGKFNSVKEADKYAEQLHQQQAKMYSSQSELNSAEEQKAPEVSTYLKKPYNALVEAGMTPERSQYVLDFMDTDNNDSIKQSEMWAFYEDNPDYEDYVIAMWNSYGYKTTWEAYKAKHK